MYAVVVTPATETFVIASGYCWSSHLLLLSSSTRFPNGLANSSGELGHNLMDHHFRVGAHALLDETRRDVERSPHEPSPA